MSDQLLICQLDPDLGGFDAVEVHVVFPDVHLPPEETVGGRLVNITQFAVLLLLPNDGK